MWLIAKVVERLSWRRTTGEQKPYKAMYSSLIGGITLDQALMVIPIDDHMVHRGHGVFDTTMIMNGYAQNILPTFIHLPILINSSKTWTIYLQKLLGKFCLLSQCKAKIIAERKKGILLFSKCLKY